VYALVIVNEICSNEGRSTIQSILVDPESKWFFRHVFDICI